MVLYPNKLPESERVCSGICNLGMQLFQKLAHIRFCLELAKELTLY